MSKLSNSLDLLQQMSADWDKPDDGDGSSPSFEISSANSQSSSQLTKSVNAAQSTLILPLSEIIVANRIRQYLDTEKTESLARSIRQHGFRGVLWVRQVEECYHLIAGGRRYAACQMAGIESVPVEVWNISDAEAIQLELLENFQREDLNPIEEAEGVLRMLEVTLELERTEVVALLNRMARQGQGRGSSSKEPADEPANNVVRNSKSGLEDATNGSANNVVRNVAGSDEHELYQQVEEVFRVIGRYSPGSFRAHRLPLLNLPNSLIEAVSSGRLEYTKAQAIGRIKDETARDEALTQVIEEGLSYSQVGELVKQVIAETADSKPPTEEQVFRFRTDTVLKRMRSAKLESKARKKIEKLLSQIEELLG